MSKTAEEKAIEVLDITASKFMLRWDRQDFMESHPRLFKSIIKSMIIFSSEQASQQKPEAVEEKLFDVAIFFYRRGFFEEKSGQFDKHFDDFNKHCEEFTISRPEAVEWLSEEEISDNIYPSINGLYGSDCDTAFMRGAKWAQSELKKRLKPVDTNTVDAVEFAEFASHYTTFPYPKLNGYIWHKSWSGSTKSYTTQELLNLYIESKK